MVAQWVAPACSRSMLRGTLDVRAGHVLRDLGLLPFVGVRVLRALLLDHPHSHQLALPVPQQHLQHALGARNTDVGCRCQS